MTERAEILQRISGGIGLMNDSAEREVVRRWWGAVRPLLEAPRRGEFTEERLRDLCRMYDQRITQGGAGTAQKADTSRMDVFVGEKVRHLRWMLECIPGLPDDGKVNRWLGFVQGVLSALGMYTIDELRDHVTEAKR